LRSDTSGIVAVIVEVEGGGSSLEVRASVLKRERQMQAMLRTVKALFTLEIASKDFPNAVANPLDAKHSKPTLSVVK